MLRKRQVMAVTSSAVVVAASLMTRAATYEVGAAKPFTSIQSALDQAQADLLNNVYSVPATITVYSGTYNEQVFVPADPTNNQFINTKYDGWTLQAAPNANVLVRGSITFGSNKEFMTLDGINIDNSNAGDADPFLDSALNFDGVTSRDNTFKNAVIYGLNPDDNAVRGNFSYGVNTLDHVTIYGVDYGMTGNSNAAFVVKNSIIAGSANRGFFSTQPSSIQYSDVYGNNPNFGGGQSNDGGNLNFGTGLDPLFVTTDPNNPYFLYLNPLSPAAHTGQGNTNMGARPVFDPHWDVDSDGAWPATSNWMFAIVPNSTNTKAVFGDVITASRTVTLSSSQTVGHVVFDNGNSYVITGSSALNLSVTTGEADITVNAGSHTISAPINVNSSATVTVTPANSTLSLTNTMTYGASVTLTKAGAGTLLVKNVRSSGLTVSGGLVRMTADSSSAGVSRVDALAIASGARLDLGANKLVTQSAAGTWNGSAYTGVTSLVASGRGSGTWNGATGIVTSQTTATSGNLTSIGIARASDIRPATVSTTAVWAGQTITGTDTLVMYTYGGDATLDGKINIDDYVRIDSGVAGNLTGWSNGDFNYDGKVNIDDYTTTIDANIGNQNGFVFPTASGIDAGVAGSVAAVPEPAVSLISSIGALAMLTRVRRSRRNLCP
jgi:hypothetical protein